MRDLLLPPVDCRTSNAKVVLPLIGSLNTLRISLKIASSLISDVRLIFPTSPALESSSRLRGIGITFDFRAYERGRQTMSRSYVYILSFTFTGAFCFPNFLRNILGRLALSLEEEKLELDYSPWIEQQEARCTLHCSHYEYWQEYQRTACNSRVYQLSLERDLLSSACAFQDSRRRGAEGFSKTREID